MPEPFSILLPRLRHYFQGLWLLYLAAAIWALPHSDPVAVAGLVLIFAVSGLVRPVPNPLGGIMDPNSVLVAAVALLWRPQEVLLGVGLGSFLGLLLFRRNELWRACNNAAGWGLPAMAASGAAHLAIGAPGPRLVTLTAGAVLAVVTNRILNTGIFAVYRSQRFEHAFWPDWRQSILFQWPNQFLGAPLAIVLALIAGRIANIWATLALTALGGLALPVTRQEYAYYARSHKTLDEIVEAVLLAEESNDPGARAHGDSVSALAVAAGRRLRMTEHEVTALGMASRLHDVGLLAGPRAEAYPGADAEMAARILAPFPEPLIATFVRARYERWDGEGIPNHRRGAAIPLGARILAVAAEYDVARRGLEPSHPPRSHEDAAEYLRGRAGSVFDPAVTEAVLQAAAEQQQQPVEPRA